MNLDPVLDLLRIRSGLDPGTLGHAAVRGAVLERLHATGLEPANYATRLAMDPGELTMLITAVVVPETWFFRGGSLFAHLVRLIRDHPRRPFRALSLPCSTGEEPYSLAIALAEAGLPAGACQIQGVDVSPRAIRAAQNAIYSDLSFRETSKEIRENYFRSVPGGEQLASHVRAGVRFLVGNLLDPNLLRGERPFDLVFCRNLFIYLTPAARRQGIEVLARLVAAEGLLCLGHAEALPPEETRFVRVELERTLIYRRTDGPAPPSSPAPAARLALPAPQASVPARQRMPVPSVVETPVGGVAALERARSLADRGEYAEALSLVEETLEREGPSADRLTLLGVLYQALHDHLEARRCYERALHLAPDHRDALLHLMLLYKHEGDLVRAASLHRRLELLSRADLDKGAGP